MRNICFFNSTVAWGGGEKWHLEVSSHMHQKGHQVLVIAHPKGVLLNKLTDMKIPCMGIHVGNLSFLNCFQVNSLKKILQENNIDTIVINLSRDLKFAGLAAKKAKIKRIIYRRGSAIPIKNSFLNRYYFKKVVTDILANSIATKKTVLRNNPDLFPEKKIMIIYNGIDIDKYEMEQNGTLSTKSDKDEVILINLGRLEFQKNQKFLIHLAKELKRRRLNFRLLIGGEGSLKGPLLDLIQKLEVSDKVELMGFIEHPKAFLEGGDIFLLSSLWEGFGYVLAEASLCKKPIVAFDVSSNPEVVLNEKTGYLTPIADINKFSDAIEKLYRNPQLRKTMGQAGHDYAKTVFNSENILMCTECYLNNGNIAKT